MVRRIGWVAALMAMAVATAGCESSKNPFDPDKPLDKMSKEEWCAYYAYYLTNPSISTASRDSAKRQMRARGCANAA